MSIPLIEKTLAHPTDPICWEDLPGGECEMEFRSPSALNLSLSTTQLAFSLTKPCMLASGAAWLFYWIICPRLNVSFDPLSLLVYVTVLAIVGISILLRPHGLRTLKSSRFRLAVLVSVFVWMGVLVQHVIGYDVRLLGLAILLASVPAIQRLRNDVEEHARHWLSAGLEKQSGRDSMRSLRATSPENKAYFRERNTGEKIAFLSLLITPAAAVALWVFEGSFWTGFALMIQLAGVKIASVILSVGAEEPGELQDHLLGHWMKYDDSGHIAPGMFKSPTGNRLERLIVTWCAAASFTVALAAMTSNIPVVVEFEGNPHALDAVALCGWVDHLVAGAVAPWILAFLLRSSLLPISFLPEVNDG